MSSVEGCPLSRVSFIERFHCSVLSASLFLQLFQGAGVDESYSLLDADRVWHKAWFPVFFELSRIITRCKLDVRTR